MTKKAWIPLGLALPPTDVQVQVTYRLEARQGFIAQLSSNGIWLTPKPARYRDRWDYLGWTPTHWRHIDG